MPQTPFPIQQGEKAASLIAWLELLCFQEEVGTGNPQFPGSLLPPLLTPAF